MLDQAKVSKHEVSGAYTKDGRVIVFAEFGNTKGSANNYVVTDCNKNYVIFGNEKVEVEGFIHTHPGELSRDYTNPLRISGNDKDISTHFDNKINVLMNNILYNVSTTGNGLMYPQEIWSRK